MPARAGRGRQAPGISRTSPSRSLVRRLLPSAAPASAPRPRETVIGVMVGPCRIYGQLMPAGTFRKCGYQPCSAASIGGGVMEERPAVKERVETKRVEEAKDPVGRYTRVGLWALPVFALLLGVGTSTHQPPPQTQLADWSRYVTTDIFLIKHLVASIGGAVFGVLGIVAMGIAFVRLGSIRLGLWGLVTGVAANVLLSSIFGVAAYTQPAIGRFFLAGHHDLAQSLYYDAAQGTPMVLMALTGL